MDSAMARAQENVALAKAEYKKNIETRFMLIDRLINLVEATDNAPMLQLKTAEYTFNIIDSWLKELGLPHAQS